MRRAWAVYTLCNQGMAGMIGGVWSYAKKPNPSGKDSSLRKLEKAARFCLRNEKGLFAMQERLRQVQLECRDACRVILARDTAETFFYIDPPYINSDQGHYKGYKVADFEELLNTLATVQGKFLLSCYDSEIMRQFAATHNWKVETFEMMLCANHIAGASSKRRKKIECLVRNYETQ